MSERGQKEYEAYIASLPPRRYKSWRKQSPATKARFAAQAKPAPKASKKVAKKKVAKKK